MTNLISNSASLSCITSAPVNYSSVPQRDTFGDEIAGSQIKNTSDESVTITQRFLGLTTKERICTGLLSTLSLAELALSQLAGHYLAKDDYALAMSICIAGAVTASAPIFCLICYRTKQQAEDQMQLIELNDREEKALETVQEGAATKESVAAKPCNQTVSIDSKEKISQSDMSEFLAQRAISNNRLEEPPSCSEGKFKTRAIVHT